MIAARRDVFGRHQPLGDGRAHAALQYDGHVDAPDFLQQVEVLHVARADLDHVDLLAQERVEHAHVHQLGDHGQPVARCRVLEELEAVDARALERVWDWCAA